MQRTQIYLDKKIIRMLARLSNRTGKTRSELIRDALQQIYLQSDVKETVNKIVGLRSFSDLEFEGAISQYRKERQW